MDISQQQVLIAAWPGNGRFTIDQPINQNMVIGSEICARDPDAYSRKAFSQWSAGIERLRSLDLDVLVLEAEYGASDAAFKRDNFACIGGKIVLAKHPSSTRREEIEDIRRIIRSDYIVELQGKDSYLEGGDVLAKTNGVIPIGWGPRTTYAAVEELRRLFPNERFLPLTIKGPHFHGDETVLAGAKCIHADTAACFLPYGDLVVRRAALAYRSWKAAERLATRGGRNIYRLSAKEAKDLASNINAVTNGDLLAVPLNSDPGKESQLRDWLLKLGYNVHELECGNFVYSDGGWHCLVNKVGHEMLTPEAQAMLVAQRSEWQTARQSGPNYAVA